MIVDGRVVFSVVVVVFNEMNVLLVVIVAIVVRSRRGFLRAPTYKTVCCSGRFLFPGESCFAFCLQPTLNLHIVVVIFGFISAECEKMHVILGQG